MLGWHVNGFTPCHAQKTSTERFPARWRGSRPGATSSNTPEKGSLPRCVAESTSMTCAFCTLRNRLGAAPESIRGVEWSATGYFGGICCQEGLRATRGNDSLLLATTTAPRRVNERDHAIQGELGSARDCRNASALNRPSSRSSFWRFSSQYVRIFSPRSSSLEALNKAHLYASA